ncbi:variant leucine-rich repeat-containing protein [Nesterenkonia haasae]|uniref:variant leucine-rich repeat-containing protein n=1 Tax=Nesterenkonia haasae TaxID=2587813 RepID=UPI001390B93A|nr:hypothetical protein [Nesterenkonia haasae]NDK33156.1 hypothetical protein [Nesterenkonia haasae]
MTENHDLEALASNPHTDWDVLHWIAENHPELRPVIAANPGAYQELIDALGALGDPRIDAAIAQREAAGGVTSAPETDPLVTSPLDGLWDTTGYTLAAQQAAASAPEPEPEPSEPTGPEPLSASESEPAPAPEPEPAPDPAPAPEPVPTPVPVSAPEAESEPQVAEEPEPQRSEMPAFLAAAPTSAESESPRRGLPLYPIAAVVLGLLGVGAIIGLLVVLFGGDDDDQPVAEPPAPTSPAPEEDDDDVTEDPAGENGTEDAAATEDEEDDEADQEAIEEARTAVAGLPEESSCETDTDASVVAAFLAVAAEDDGWASDEDPDMLESTFGSLQSECSSTHAAAVFESARSGAQAPEDGHGEMLTSVGTQWVDREIELRGAEQMSGFSAQNGNVECEFDDGVTCTVYQTNPQLCDEGTTYTMTVDGVDVDCDAHIEPGGRETLNLDENATDGFLVCMEMSDRVTCYNSIDPFGFEISNTGNYSY